MNTSNIPRTFWHALSISILASTVVFLIIAYRSSEISIKIADATIHLKQSIENTKEIQRQLEEDNNKLIKALTAIKQQSAESHSEKKQFYPALLDKSFIPPERFEEMGKQLQYIETSLKEIPSL